jgi:hypothetical protein
MFSLRANNNEIINREKTRTNNMHLADEAPLILSEMENLAAKQTEDKHKPVILFWTQIFQQNPNLAAKAADCGEISEKCVFTDDRKQLEATTAVVFHAPDIQYSLHEIKVNLTNL